MFYQTFFTALSVFGIGIFDRDLDSQYLEDVPPLHIYGIKQHWFNARRFWVFMVEGVIQSVIVYFFVIGAYGEEVTSAQGWISDQFTMGTTMAITAITNANLFVGANSSSWTWPQIFCVFFGIAAVFVYLPLYSQSLSAYAWGEVQQVFGSAVFWTTFALTTCMMQGPRLTYLYLFRNYKPTDINIVEEIQKLGLEDELEWAIDTSRPPDDSEEHYAPKPPPSHGSMAAMPPLGAPPLGRFVSSAVSPALPGSPEMVQLDLSRKPLPPLLVPASEATDSPESIHRPTTTISPYNTTFMVTAGSVASTGSMTETEAMRVARGGSTSIRDMLTDTIVPHRGYSFSQGRGASIIILGAKIKEKWVSTWGF